MGFYLRRAIKVGPFRFNISKSGLGVSGGVTGLRVGKSPRGNYVHMGRHGVYYRSGFSNGARATHGPTSPGSSPAEVETSLPMESLTGAETVELASSSSSELLTQIQEAQKRISVWPWAAAAVVLLAGVGSNVGDWLMLLILVSGGISVGWLWMRDKARKTVVIFYEVDDAPAGRFDALVGSFRTAAKSRKVWHMKAEAQIRDAHTRKVSGGAGVLIDREDATPNEQGPKVIASNIAIPTITAKSRSVYFLPDRVLVLQGNTYADVPWESVDPAFDHSRFIESGSVPADAEVVGKTWKYVNKSGGPDKRFKDNRQLSVCLYGDLILTSPTGFRGEWQFSAKDAPKALTMAITEMRTPQPG